MNGVIIKTTGKHYTVKSDLGDILDCRLKGKLRISGIKSTNPFVVGDRVEVSYESNQWLILSLHKRKNYILRKSVNLSKQTHIIASNIDQAILMITLSSPITTTAFIDRFLISANAFGVEVILVFNKIDLLNKDLKLKHKELKDMYEKIGYKCLSISVINDDLSLIKEELKGKVNMIAGHSGVGKSTLINGIQPGLNLNTKEISKSHHQGQHTTTFSELHDLDFGGAIIDTPGIRGFGLVSIELNQIASYFPEFLIFKKNCKFHNCIHKNEPKCAVKSALKLGDISSSRYNNYLKMLNDIDGFRVNDY